MTAIELIQEELKKAKSELNMLFEISNAMRTTLQLDEILYIILTGVTSHVGLGFNRALLFLVNETDNIIEGKMAIGPDTGEEAKRIWRHIEEAQKDLDDLINAFQSSNRRVESSLQREIMHFKIPLHNNQNNLLALCVNNGMSLHLTDKNITSHKDDPLIKLLNNEELAIIPLRGKDKVNGLIVADNIFTRKPITNDDLRLLMMFANQAGLAVENSQLYESAIIRSHTDSLTNLWNHGYFQYLLQKDIEKAEALQEPLSVIMVDIDNFKHYNDTWGHQMGDTILKEMAKMLKDYSRKIDSVCRYGGEEFSIILPKTSHEEALRIAEKLRESVSMHRFSHENIMPEKVLTASFGVAAYPIHGNISSQLLSHSDHMLFKAKKEGKNRVC